MQPAIIRRDPASEYSHPEGCFITELVNTGDDPALSIARARIEPGTTTRRHRLAGTAERYYILQGSGLMEVGGLPPQEVEAGDIVLIPPMCSQRITNIGTGDLIFLALCTPRFENRAYRDTEDDAR